MQPRLRSALAGHAEQFELDLPDAAGRRADRHLHFVPARGRDGFVHGVYSVALEAGPDAALSATLHQGLETILGLVQLLRRDADDGLRAVRLAGIEAVCRRLQQSARDVPDERAAGRARP